MFDNAGEKMKRCAIAIFVVGAIAMAIIGLMVTVAGIMSDGEVGIVLGIAIIVLGVGVSWLTALGMYGFGELIERVCRIEEKTSDGTDGYSYQKQEIKKNISSVFKADGVMDIPKREKVNENDI